MKKLLSLLLLMGLSFQASAVDVLKFSNLDRGDVEEIMKDFQTSFEPTTISGASSLGTIIGFEAGLFFGLANADKIDQLGGGDISKLPVAGLFGRVDTLYGLGAEVTLLPVDLGDFQYTNYSVAAKWTFSKMIPFLPVSLRARLRMTNTDLKFDGDDGTTSYTGEVNNKSTSFDITVSKNLLLVEPYAGIGYVTSKGDFKAGGSSNVFSFATANQEVSGVKNSGTHIFFGANVNLLLISFGAEYSRLFGNDRYMLKTSFGF